MLERCSGLGTCTAVENDSAYGRRRRALEKDVVLPVVPGMEDSRPPPEDVRHSVAIERSWACHVVY